MESRKVSIKKEKSDSINQSKLNDELKFKLDFEFKNELNVVLNEFTSSLYDNKIKENIIEKTNNLLHKFVDLPIKLNHIEESEINLINNQLKPTLVIDSEMRTTITDLLIKNKYYSILLNETGHEDAKSNLIEENNNLVIRLMQYPIQILKADLIDNNLPNQINESNHIDLRDDKSIVDNEIDSDDKRSLKELRADIFDLSKELKRIAEENSKRARREMKDKFRSKDKITKAKVPLKKKRLSSKFL